MSEHSQDVFVVYRLDDLHESFQVAGIYTRHEEARAHAAELDDRQNPVVVPMSMDGALATIREESQNERFRRLQLRLDGIAERIGQLAAVIAAHQVAA